LLDLRRFVSSLVALLCAAFMLLLAARAGAEPQLTSGLTVGVAGVGDRSELWSGTRFTGGLRGELLFSRSKDTDWGIGPYVEVLTTSSFDDVKVGAGASLLVPVHEYLPLVVSAGGYGGYRSPWGWEPGLAAELFWGMHGYNYHSLYSMSAGIFAGGRYGLGDSKEVAMLVGGRIDLEMLAIPFLFAWGAIKGSNPSR
jgi:hypothetical protein